jgi:hypothetical protein
MTINNESVIYSKGSNIAWTIPESGPSYFDELGMNINVEDIDILKARYQSFTVAAGAGWSTAGKDIPDGVYQFTLTTKVSGESKCSIFIAMFKDEISLTTDSGIVKITNDFDTYWELDVSNNIKLKSTVLTACKITYMKVGEV